MATKIPKIVMTLIVEATRLREQRKAIQKREKPIKDRIKAYMKGQGVTTLTVATGETAETSKQDRWYYEKDRLMVGLELTDEEQLRKFQRRQEVVSLKCHRK